MDPRFPIGGCGKTEIETSKGKYWEEEVGLQLKIRVRKWALWVSLNHI